MSNVSPITPGGQVMFYDNFIPSLKDGQYSVTISQTLLANQAQTQQDGGSAIPNTVVGTTAGLLSGKLTSIMLNSPGAGLAIGTGTSLALLTPNGQDSTVVVTAAPVKKGDVQIAIQPSYFSNNFLAGSNLLQSSPQPPITQTFIVRGPRFALAQSDVHKVFPPPNGSGSYDEYLPMIVLNKRALPWERSLKPAVPQPQLYPWVALLLFTPDELLVPQPPVGNPPPPQPANSQQNLTGTASLPLTNIVNATYNGTPTLGPPAGTLGPTILLEDDEDPHQIYCNIIEIDAGTFTALIPTLNDLRFLTHVRQVSTGNKAPLNSVHDGWFACASSNRFAVSPPGSLPPGPQSFQRNIAHLVSLEGLEPYLGLDDPVTLSNFKKVRLISLYSWSFSCLTDPQENFRELMLNLISANSERDTDLLLRLPLPSWAADFPLAPGAQLIAHTQLQNGYAPISYATITGELTFTWYRGPLAPVVTPNFLGTTGPGTPNNPATPLNSAEAMIYDASTGLFDQSYAVAFQTGRSLALANLPFATNLLQWRRKAHALVDLLLEYMRSPTLASIFRSEGVLDASGNLTATGTTGLADLLDSGLVSSAFVDYLASGFSNSLANQIGRMGGSTRKNIHQQPSKPLSPQPIIPADLSKLMQNPDVVSWLQQLSGLAVSKSGAQQFEASIMPEQIVDWLARRALLYEVPFNNLVANEQMIPMESIRFFYIDQNWIDSLLDGALSVGIQSSRDSLFHQLMRDPLHRAVDAVTGEVRDKLLGISPPSAPPSGTMAGFILRSAVVAGWPGLEVRAWSQANSVNPMKPLRLDRIAPTVMIGIFPDVPVRLEFNEPSEGLVFGVEDEGIALRYLPGTYNATATNIGQVINPTNPIWLTPASLRLLRRKQPLNQPAFKIAGQGGLVEAIQNMFPAPLPSLGPAALAVQLVKVPEQMLFEP